MGSQLKHFLKLYQLCLPRTGWKCKPFARKENPAWHQLPPSDFSNRADVLRPWSCE